ncbi:MAG: hypothetical protein H7A25_06475 [Leptospiraceae bacterium]|nr:hypothetical protein [Leptospiraceae bacterium]MCP5499530.1 hypothetical protein [Leptospiraceae bacterium]
MVAKFLERVKDFFLREEDLGESYSEELNIQAKKVLIIACVVGTFIWLPYISLDRVILSSEPSVPFLRLGLSLVSLIILGLQFLPSLQKHRTKLLACLLFYLEVSTGLISGISKCKPVYIGGYYFVILAPVILPIQRMHAYLILMISLVSFSIFALFFGSTLSGYESVYQIADFIGVVIFAFFLIYYMDRLRFSHWKKTSLEKQQRERYKQSVEMVEGIIQESETLLKEVKVSGEVLTTFSNDLKNVVDRQMLIFADNQKIEEHLLSSFKKFKDKTEEQIRLNNEGKNFVTVVQGELEVSSTIASKANMETNKAFSAGKESIVKLEEIRNTIDRLKQESRRIEEISRSINEIADRTNLLSLNASIESARAGVHGKGFVVVAGEVSKLADKSMESSREIGGIINSSIQTINEASKSIKNISYSISEISMFIESDKKFLTTFGEVVKRQEENISKLVRNLDISSQESREIDLLADENLSRLSSSEDRKKQLHRFATKLKNMSGNIDDISDNLYSYITKLNKKLQEARRIH